MKLVTTAFKQIKNLSSRFSCGLGRFGSVVWELVPLVPHDKKWPIWINTIIDDAKLNIKAVKGIHKLEVGSQFVQDIHWINLEGRVQEACHCDRFTCP